MKNLSNSHYLQNHQYKDAAKLNARIRLHQEFGTNPYGWYLWVFDLFHLPRNGRLLELGCGPGNLWVENGNRIPPGWRIILSDFSQGMVKRAQQNMLPLPPQFDFEIIDAQEIPHPPENFDAVVANHMFYHIPNQEKALSEIRRILKPGGRAYFSTVGEGHMSELSDLVRKFDPSLAAKHQAEKINFTLESGEAQLGRWFSSVRLHRQEDVLRVTEAGVLVDFVLAGIKLGVGEDRRDEFTDFLAKELKAQGKVILINKENGVLEAIR